MADTQTAASSITVTGIPKARIQCVVREIITTERSYVKGLQAAVDWSNAELTRKTLTEQQIKALLSTRMYDVFVVIWYFINYIILLLSLSRAVVAQQFLK